MPALDADSQAAKTFFREVSQFSERVKPWEVAVFHDVMPDEQYDPTLVSRRVYGRPDEFMTVMAAAGVDHVDMPLPLRRIVLPTEAQLHVLKRRAGFESKAEYRDGGKPVWVD